MINGWFLPTFYVPRIAHIDFAELAMDGVRGVIVDLDNTLVGYRALQPNADDAAWVAQAPKRGISIVLVTNNSTPWAAEVAQRLGIPIVANARKPLPWGFRRALATLDLPREAVIVIGDQLFTDVLGAKLFGLRAILVEPLVRHDPWNTRPLRMLERWVLRGLPRPGLDSNRQLKTKSRRR